jgi:transposase-like protein
MQAHKTATKTKRRGWRQWRRQDAARVLAAQVDSGLSLVEFAQQEGLELARLYRWRRVLGEAGGPKAAEQTLRRRGVTLGGAPATARGPGLRFIPVGTVSGRGHEGEAARGPAAVTIRMAEGIAVEIGEPGRTSATWVAALVQGLRAAGEEAQT